MTMKPTETGASRYPNVVAFIRDTPWQILESKLLEITNMVALRAAGHQVSDDDVEQRLGGRPSRRDTAQKGGVAVIPMYGVITPKADLMTEMSGGTSIDRFQADLRAAVNDPNVSAIVLDVDSPGGSVSMLQEAAQQIRAARSKKPVVAVANGLAASAAYRLASQATEFVATPSGSVGSIGTLAVHEDISKALEMAGIKPTIVKSGKFKAEGSPYEPLSEEAHQQWQDTVDKHQQSFEQDVARGRRVPVETVRSDFGQGRVFLAQDALKAGMIDRVDTLDNVIAGLQAGQRPRPATQETGDENVKQVAVTSFTVDADDDPPGDDPQPNDLQAAASGLSFADEADALHDSARGLVDRVTSLAEVQRGHLTVSKRDRLTACTGALREAVETLTGVLEATNPDKHRDEAAGEFALFLARATTGGQAR